MAMGEWEGTVAGTAAEGSDGTLLVGSAMATFGFAAATLCPQTCNMEQSTRSMKQAT